MATPDMPSPPRMSAVAGLLAVASLQAAHGFAAERPADIRSMADYVNTLRHFTDTLSEVAYDALSYETLTGLSGVASVCAEYCSEAGTIDTARQQYRSFNCDSDALLLHTLVSGLQATIQTRTLTEQLGGIIRAGLPLIGAVTGTLMLDTYRLGGRQMNPNGRQKLAGLLLRSSGRFFPVPDDILHTQVEHQRPLLEQQEKHDGASEVFAARRPASQYHSSMGLPADYPQWR